MAKPPKKIKDKPQPPKGGNGDKGKLIIGLDARRDPNSGAVVFKNDAAYQKRVKAKRAGKNILIQQKKIEKQQVQINNIEKKLDQLIALLENG